MPTQRKQRQSLEWQWRNEAKEHVATNHSDPYIHATCPHCQRYAEYHEEDVGKEEGFYYSCPDCNIRTQAIWNFD